MQSPKYGGSPPSLLLALFASPPLLAKILECLITQHKWSLSCGMSCVLSYLIKKSQVSLILPSMELALNRPMTEIIETLAK